MHTQEQRARAHADFDAEEEDMQYDIQEWSGTSLSNLEAEIEQDKPVSFKLGDIFPNIDERKE